LVKVIKKHPFIRNVLTIMTGTAIAQALNIMIAPLLSRLYDPHAFGVFAVYTSIVSIFIVVAGLRYELAIVLPKKQEEAVNVLYLSIIAVVLMTLLSIVVLFLFRDYLELWFHIQGFEEFIWWIPISILFFGIYNSLNYWSTRQKSFKRLSISQILRSISVAVTQLGGGISKVGSVGLIAGQAVGHTVATVALGKQIWKEDRKTLSSSFNLKKIKELAYKYKEFPIYSAPQALVNSLSQNAAPFILAAYFSPTVVGYYALSLRLLQLPINLIGESVRQVFYQRVAEIYNEGENLQKYLVKATTFLGAIIFIPSIFIFIFGPNLFSIILGKEWYEAGVYSQWMMLWLMFGFMNRPASATAQVLGLQKFLFYYELLFLVSRLTILGVGACYLSASHTILTYSIVGAIFNLALIVSVIFSSKNDVKTTE